MVWIIGLPTVPYATHDFNQFIGQIISHNRPGFAFIQLALLIDSKFLVIVLADRAAKPYTGASWRPHAQRSASFRDNIMQEGASTIGMTLINLLQQQLEAEVHFLNVNGTPFKLSFEKANVKGSGSSLMKN